jgi:hypothetical protein
MDGIVAHLQCKLMEFKWGKCILKIEIINLSTQFKFINLSIHVMQVFFYMIHKKF